MEEVCANARRSCSNVASLSGEQKNEIIVAFGKELKANSKSISEANELDCQRARETLGDGTYDRLILSEKKFSACLDGVRAIVQMEDPVGKCTLHNTLSEGLELFKLTCPIGVVAIIFEARPDVAVQVIALGVKTGNVLILKGGKEASNTNKAIIGCFHSALKGLEGLGIPSSVVQLIDTREQVGDLLRQSANIDLVIPRGSKQLVQHVMNNTNIPVLGHADGLCCIYIDEHAAIKMGVDIVEDAKLNYPAACNAVETILVHDKVLSSFLPVLAERLANASVSFRADSKCLPYLPASVTKPATPEDFKTEFLSKTMAVKCVGNVEEAVHHINCYGSHHTDSIVTDNASTAETFLSMVDSAGVYHNCSTRFADGYRYGFGAEIGISTNRIHARGPVGIDGLLIYKYRLYGRGHTVGGFTSGKSVSVKPLMPELDSVRLIRAKFCVDIA